MKWDANVGMIVVFQLIFRSEAAVVNTLKTVWVTSFSLIWRRTGIECPECTENKRILVGDD